MSAQKQRRFGAGTSGRDHLHSDARMTEAFLQVQDDLARLGAKQMLPCALRAAFDRPDRKDIDVARGYLENVPAVIEQLRMTAIENYTANRVARFIGYCIEKGFVHS